MSPLQGEDPAYLWLPCWSGPPGLVARAVEALQRDDAPIAQPGTLPDLQVGAGSEYFQIQTSANGAVAACQSRHAPAGAV